MLDVTRVFAIVLFQSDYRLRAHQAPCFARAARYASVLISSDIPMGADDDALTGLIGAGALLILLLLRAAPERCFNPADCSGGSDGRHGIDCFGFVGVLRKVVGHLWATIAFEDRIRDMRCDDDL